MPPSSWKRLAGLSGCALTATATAAAYYYAQPTYSTHSTPHSPLTASDCTLLRCAPTGTPVSPHNNPGVRAHPSLLSPAAAASLKDEVTPLIKKYGISLISRPHAAIYAWQQSYLSSVPPPPVDMMRVTGRPEHLSQTLPPWGYGESFKVSQLPPQLSALVDKVRQLSGIKLGPLRDVTLNYRHGGFLRLDPHVDPAEDGSDVFIIGLDSDTVLTLCPLRRWHLLRWLDAFLGLLKGEDDRAQLQRQSESSSWTAADIDVLALAGTLVHLSGDARWVWTHGTRLGAEAWPQGAEVIDSDCGSHEEGRRDGVTSVTGLVSGSGSLAFAADAPVAVGAAAVEAGQQACMFADQTSGECKQHGGVRTRAPHEVDCRRRLHDWWGSPTSVVLRGVERTSVVLAFGPL